VSLFLAFALATQPAAQAVVTPASEGPRALACPDTLAGFVREMASATLCEYAHPDGAEAALRLSPSPGDGAPAEGRLAALPEHDTPSPFAGEIYHMGESESGDAREESWRADLGGSEITVTVRYEIPGFARRDLEAFGAAAVEANALAPAARGGEDIACPDAPEPFLLEARFDRARAGAAARWACAYLHGAAYAYYYAPTDIEAARETFEAQLSDGAEPAETPEGAPDAARAVRDNGINRALWLAGEGNGLRALEADWTEATPPETVAALAAGLGF